MSATSGRAPSTQRTIEARRGLVFDGDGPVGSVVTAGPAAEAFTAVFRGRAAHAGTEPENGVSAIAMMARAIDRMQLGRVSTYTVANIGTVNGGQAMNIVPAEVTLVGQARSLRQRLLDTQIEHMREVMEEAAEEFGGTVEYEETNRIAGIRVFRHELGRQVGRPRHPIGRARTFARLDGRRQRRA